MKSNTSSTGPRPARTARTFGLGQPQQGGSSQSSPNRPRLMTEEEFHAMADAAWRETVDLFEKISAQGSEMPPALLVGKVVRAGDKAGQVPGDVTGEITGIEFEQLRVDFSDDGSKNFSMMAAANACAALGWDIVVVMVASEAWTLHLSGEDAERLLAEGLAVRPAEHPARVEKLVLQTLCIDGQFDVIQAEIHSAQDAQDAPGRRTLGPASNWRAEKVKGATGDIPPMHLHETFFRSFIVARAALDSPERLLAALREEKAGQKQGSNPVGAEMRAQPRNQQPRTQVLRAGKMRPM